VQPIKKTGKPSIYEYNWRCMTCRARFLAALPSNDQRKGWLDRWRKELDADTIDSIRQQAMEILNAQRK